MFKNERHPALQTERWTGIARLLVDYLDQFRDQQDFLREIDRSIIGGGSLDDLLQLVACRTRELFSFARVSFYAIEGGKAQRKAVSAAPDLDDDPLSLFPMEDMERCFHRHEQGTGIWTASGGDGCPLGFRGESVLAVPARRGDHDVGLLMIESDQDARISQFCEPEVCRFLSTVAGQAAVALHFHEQLSDVANLWNIANASFRQGGDLQSCLNMIAERFKDFLPAGGRSRTIYVQILLLENSADGPVLAIRGSYDPDRAAPEEPVITRVSIDHSVCGLLFKPPWPSYVLCDPTEDEPYKELYKRYLGKGGRGARQDIRSELAIPLLHQGEPFAVINLESKQKNAFPKQYLEQYREKAAHFVPMLLAIKERIQSHSLTQTSTLQALESYLALIGTQYLHSLRTPYSALGQGLALLRTAVPQENATAHSTLEDIQAAVASIYKLQSGFAADLNDFASPKRHEVKNLLEGAIGLFNTTELARNNGIEITADLAKGVVVECSLFMKQVFYNIIDNAIIWLNKKREVQPEHQGRIRVELKNVCDPSPDEEVTLNRFCQITIHDNGPGIDAENMGKILNDAFSMRGQEGTGFGLFAANQYVLSLGGRLKLASEPGEFFQVTINLRRVDAQN